MGELASAKVSSAVHIELKVDALVVVGTQEDQVLVLDEARAIAVQPAGLTGLSRDNVRLFAEDQPGEVGAACVNGEESPADRAAVVTSRPQDFPRRIRYGHPPTVANGDRLNTTRVNSSEARTPGLSTWPEARDGARAVQSEADGTVLLWSSLSRLG